MFVQLFLVFLILVSLSGMLGWKKVAVLRSGRQEKPRSRPVYHGFYSALWCALPMLVVALAWLAVEPGIIRPAVLGGLGAATDTGRDSASLRYDEIKNIAGGVLPSDSLDVNVSRAVGHYRQLQRQSGIVLAVVFFGSGLAGLFLGYRRLGYRFPAREKVENFIRIVLFVSASIAVLTTISIVLALAVETLRFFQHVPVTDFLFGTKWSPQVAIRADQVGSSGAFGAIPLFAGTLLIALIAMLVAVPVGLFAAIYLSEYAQAATRNVLKPMLEILAGIPTVVYGFFAALTVAPMIVAAGHRLGLAPSSESALAAGLVMGIMIIPFISSLSDDVINAVPYSLRDGSLAMGATRSETIRKVILPAALPGIAGAMLLAVSRAVGETMIVVMAAGLAANLTANPLDSVTTVTAQIVTILVGDQEFDSPKTLAAFALGLTLFFVTLVLNYIALHVVRRYREQYD